MPVKHRVLARMGDRLNIADQMRRDSGFGHFSLRLLSLRQKVGDGGDLIGLGERRRMAAIGDLDDPRGLSAGDHFGGHVDA